MNYRYIITRMRPELRQHLRHNFAMALLRLGFGAKECYDAVKISKIETSWNTTLAHQDPKRAFIRGPVARLTISRANFRSGCEARLVAIGSAGDTIQEEGKIRVFRETGQLPNSILANINELLNACVFQKFEKLLCRFPGKPDRTNAARHSLLPQLERARIDPKCELP